MRNKIIEDAKSLIDTPFHHQGRTKFGLDCAGLIVYILKNNNLYEEGCDIKAYSRLPSGNDIAKLMNKHFEKTILDNARNGDILLFRFENNPQHLAYLEIDENGDKYMIHAYGVTSVNKVVRNILDEKWVNKLVCVYKIKNIDGENK